MKILLIGGTGNISTDCAAKLHEQGQEIAVVSRGRSSVPAEYRVIAADRKDMTAFRAALGNYRPDVVINFLGFEVPEIQTDYELFKGVARQYIFISSATVYTRPASRLPYTEDSPLGNGFWDYAQKKLACEEWLRERWVSEKFPVTIVRPSHTYSRRWVPNPVSSGSFTYANRLAAGKPVIVPGDGKSLWTLTHTSDFAVALAGLVGNAKALGEAFHITSDEALTWTQIALEIAAAVDAKSPRIVPVPVETICQVAPQMMGGLKGDKAHPGVFDNSKIKQFVPEFVCRKPFREGVRESVAWLRAHPAEQNLKPELDVLIERAIAAA